MNSTMKATVVVSLHEVLNHDLPVERNVGNGDRIYAYQVFKSMVL